MNKKNIIYFIGIVFILLYNQKTTPMFDFISSIKSQYEKEKKKEKKDNTLDLLKFLIYAYPITIASPLYIYFLNEEQKTDINNYIAGKAVTAWNEFPIFNIKKFFQKEKNFHDMFFDSLKSTFILSIFIGGIYTINYLGTRDFIKKINSYFYTQRYLDEEHKDFKTLDEAYQKFKDKRISPEELKKILNEKCKKEYTYFLNKHADIQNKINRDYDIKNDFKCIFLFLEYIYIITKSNIDIKLAENAVSEDEKKDIEKNLDGLNDLIPVQKKAIKNDPTNLNLQICLECMEIKKNIFQKILPEYKKPNNSLANLSNDSAKKDTENEINDLNSYLHKYAKINLSLNNYNKEIDNIDNKEDIWRILKDTRISILSRSRIIPLILCYFDDYKLPEIQNIYYPYIKNYITSRLGFPPKILNNDIKKLRENDDKKKTIISIIKNSTIFNDEKNRLNKELYNFFSKKYTKAKKNETHKKNPIVEDYKILCADNAFLILQYFKKQINNPVLKNNKIILDTNVDYFNNFFFQTSILNF